MTTDPDACDWAHSDLCEKPHKHKLPTFPTAYDAQGVSQSDTLVQLDARRRANLAKVGKKEHTMYAVEELDDGTLVFRPAALRRQPS